MQRHGVRWVGSVALIAAALGGMAACGGFVPYRKMAQAAGSLLSPMAQAQDQRLQFEVRRAIMMDQTLAALGIGLHVFMARVFLVGRVDHQGQADALLAAAQGVPGVRSVQGYLPVEPPAGTTVLAEDVTLEGEIKAAIVATGDLVVTRYTVSVVDAHAVLMGVVASPEESAAVDAAALTVSGVKGVTNFLLPVEAGYAGVRPRLR